MKFGVLVIAANPDRESRCGESEQKNPEELSQIPRALNQDRIHASITVSFMSEKPGT